MSYLTFKLLSLAVLVVLLIVVMVKKKSVPEEESQDNIDNHHDEMYYVEYKLIPHFVEMYKDQPEKASQIVLTIYENLVTLQNHLKSVNPLAYGNVSGEVCGDIEGECLVVYEFPKPFEMPLAKYGAIYFNRAQQKYQYWTLELSINGNYVLGSKTTEGHANYGQRANLSKKEFIHEVCQSMGVDEAKLMSVVRRIEKKSPLEDSNAKEGKMENAEKKPVLSDALKRENRRLRKLT